MADRPCSFPNPVVGFQRVPTNVNRHSTHTHTQHARTRPDLVLVLQEENERLRAAANAQRSETAQRGVVPDVADALEELDALGVFGSNRGDI